MNEYENEINVKCQHCDYVDHDSPERYDLSDGSEETHCCDACGKPFIVAVSVDIRFSTYGTNHEEESLREIESEERRFETLKRYILPSELIQMKELIARLKKNHDDTDWSSV